MRKALFSAFAFLVCFVFINVQSPSSAVFAGNGGKSSAERNADSTAKRKSLKTAQQTVLWKPFSEDNLNKAEQRQIDPEKYLIFRLNKTILTNVLDKTPSEFSAALKEKSQVVELPLPDGSFAKFGIEESSVLEKGLAARFPELKTYRGQGIDDPTLTARFDWTPQGFHATILSGGDTMTIEPANIGDKSLYISYYAGDLKKGDYECLVKDVESIKQSLPQLDAPQVAVGSTLRNYRFALAATYEYARAYGGGSTAVTLSTLVTWVNGANAVYERDLSVHLNLVNNTSIIYAADTGNTAASDPYDDSNVVNMLFQATPDIESKVGAANYDIGHVMGYFGGSASGVAFVGTACAGGYKAGGATLMGGSPGNSGALGVWVHELGHEFGASHNFNGSQSNCSGSNRSIVNSYESGGGSTIMGYPQICGADNIAFSRDMRFHAMSYAAINSYLAGTGGTCSINTPTGNSAPIISGGGNRNIPKNTPFTLTASASDPNGDSLTYAWDEIDAGGSAYPQDGTAASYSDAGDPVNTTRPIFRPFAANASPSRTFPSLTYILNNANDPPDYNSNGVFTAEKLPRVGRALNFRVTARDNRSGGGGVNEDTVTLAVDNNSGPFLVTSPNSSVNLGGGSFQNVTWSVNNTNNAPISAANVKISLSTDGGNTFPNVLTNSTPNDGSEAVTIPNINTSTARIKVEAVGNVFFDISDTNFSITAGTVSTTYEGDVSGRPSGDGFVDSSDAQQIRNFSVGIGTPYQSNEFQRADCSPRNSLGDGFVDGDDVAQARRYSLGLDSRQVAGGPSGPSPIAPPVSLNTASNLINGKAAVITKDGVQAAPAAFRVDAQNTSAGSTLVVPIRVDTVGNEAGYTFSIAFDSTKLTNPSVVIGNSGGDVLFNANNPGQIGFSVTTFSGGTIAEGNNKTLVTVTFAVAAGAPAGTTPITFTDTPARRKASPVDPNFPITQPTYTGGTITIGGATAAGASLSGRVMNVKGRGVANARVVITNSTGEAVATARTNGFGYYRVAEVESGAAYIVRVESKQYKFDVRTINIAQDLDGINFTAQPR